MKMTLAPGFLGRLGELPIVEPGADLASDGLMLLRSFVVVEAVVGESQSLRQYPALSVVQVEKRFDPLVAVATAIADLLFEVVEGDERQDRVTELGVFVLIDAPETTWR
ncbi:MAG: hypothetical protein HY650_14370 [Acidobacteria bacterium]|nr:hypothetical protein [Acidobacteriota bacterium]